MVSSSESLNEVVTSASVDDTTSLEEGQKRDGGGHGDGEGDEEGEGTGLVKEEEVQLVEESSSLEQPSHEAEGDMATVPVRVAADPAKAEGEDEEEGLGESGH